jgi:hypothetical protein
MWIESLSRLILSTTGVRSKPDRPQKLRTLGCLRSKSTFDLAMGQIEIYLVSLIGIIVAQETTRSQALPGNALSWRLLPPKFTN